MKKNNTVLIITNNLSLPGGITNFYRIIKNKYDKEDIEIEFFYQGVNKKHGDINKIEYLIKYIKDLIRLISYLKNNKNIKVVQLNPSFIFIPIIRDSFYIIFSKIFKKKVICFFRGWDKYFERKLFNCRIKKILFNSIYGKVDLFYVLSKDFKYSLKKIGISKKINVTKTTFDGNKFQLIGKKEGIFKMIYLGRLQKKKGIFIILKALNELKTSNRKFNFTFIGWFADDKDQKKFNKMVDSYGLKDYIDLKGYLYGKDKVLNLVNNDIFVFPSYSEGCPNVVIEALAAGLFVITTKTGALKEIIRDGVNGMMVEKGDYNDLKSCLEWCMDNRGKVKELGDKNRKYAFETFESKVIIENLYGGYKNLIGDLK